MIRRQTPKMPQWKWALFTNFTTICCPDFSQRKYVMNAPGGLRHEKKRKANNAGKICSAAVGVKDRFAP